MVDRALLAWRIAWVAAVLTGAAVQLHGRTPFSWHPAVLVTMAVVLYLVILRHPRTVGIWAWTSMVSLLPLFTYAADGFVLVVTITVLAVLADQIRRRREVQSRLAVERERTDAESTRRHVLEERTRIARELHDVVAHHMSLIAVRAQSAPYRLGDVPEATATEFGAIADASREALVEMRRLLGVLRSESAPPVRPLPSVEDVAGLVEAARAAAVDVRLDIQPDLQMPPSVGLTTYRIVQEALSNARRHASGAPVRIALAVEDAELVVTVVNGPGTALVATPGGGSTGLIGMRERATMLGGSLDTGVTEDGGFRVHGRIPLSAEHGLAAEHESGAQ
jgi:signal transduction histidine kinase